MAGTASHLQLKRILEMQVKAAVVGVLTQLLFLASSAEAAKDLSFCETPSSLRKDPPFPDIPITYQAKLELVQHYQRKSMFIEEYYDAGVGMGSMIITGYFNPGVQSQFISDGRTNEFFTIFDLGNMYDTRDNCQVDKLTDGVFTFPFYNTTSYTADNDAFMSSGTILKMANGESTTYYNGSQKMNGIYGDLWKSCFYSPKNDLTVKASYYFTKKVVDAQTSKTFPFRIDVESNGPQPFKRTFNYAFFSDVLVQDDREVVRIFETPIGTICPGRNNTKGLPSVPQAFSFRMESVDPNTNVVTATREWYDYLAKYTRIDFRNVPPNVTGEETYPTKIISDYNTGVSYFINKDTDVCTTDAIAGGQFDNLLDPSGNVRLRSPQEFFDFDQTSKWPYQYEGVHIARGILADTWISKRPLPSEDSGEGVDVIWEWYFATSDWRIQANDLTENMEPVRAVLTYAETNKPTIYNIYKFTEEEPDASIFDVSACFLSAESRAYELSFTADVKRYQLDTNQDLLRYWILFSVQAFTNISAVRIQEVEMTFGDNDFTVRFLLLGPAPNATTKVYQIPLKKAGDAFENAVTGGNFVVDFVQNKSLVQFPAKSSTLRIIRHRKRPSKYAAGNGSAAAAADSSGMTDGGLVALLVIGTIAAGVVLAVAGVWVDRRRRTTAGQSYHRHTLNMEEQ